MPSAGSEYAIRISQALHGELEVSGLLGYASELESGGRHALAAVLYRTWLKKQQTPYHHCVYFNLGVALLNERDFAGAKAAYGEAIRLSPTFLEPHLNLGLVHERAGELEAAKAAWRQIEVLASPTEPGQRPLRTQALNHLGRVLEGEHRLAEALVCYTDSLTLNPAQADTIHHWVFLRQKLCAWPVYAEIEGLSLELMQRHTSILAMLNLSDEPAVQRGAARQFVESKLPAQVPCLASEQPYRHKRIRVGYCSSDFCLHPVAMLTVELFELHDHDQFETYAFCWTREGHSPLRQRVMNAMDHFIRIDQLDDEAAARLIREHEIDILVDLQGQTLGARANMLAYRPAPIQITYLGLPATTGLPSIDYVIADRFLIPEEDAPHYSEKPLYLPDVYQVSDRQRVIGPRPSRQDCGLPAQGFVFCSFNNNYKCTPEVFSTWMAILRRVPDSVLWLLADNPATELNLRKEALARGVAEDRLVFATRIAPEHYLARYYVADLFLDSFPFNAGTTANDALWMGLPVLTCTGRTFASRMAGALLTAAGLPELITYSFGEYEEKAVALAKDPAQCQAFREHLQEVHDHGVLFDTPLFVKNLEAQFKGLLA